MTEAAETAKSDTADSIFGRTSDDGLVYAYHHSYSSCFYDCKAEFRAPVIKYGNT